MSVAALRRLERLAPDGPDTMGRELAQGPAAVDDALARIGADASALAALVGAAHRIVLVGTGASLAVARTAAPVWQSRERAGRGVIVREAAGAVLGRADGDAFGPGDLVVAISQSGGSPETLAAAHAARRAGSAVIGVTAGPGSPLADAATRPVITPLEEERGAATKSELSALAALLALSGELPADERARRALRRDLDARVARWPEAADAGAGLADARRTWIVGMGATAGLAQAAALLWHEKVRRPAVGTTASEFRHGPIEAAGPGDAVVVVWPAQLSRGLDAYLGLLCHELGEIGAAAVEVRAAPPDDVAAALLDQMLTLQQLARAAAHAAGTYRERFRVLRAVVHPAVIAD